MMEERPSAGRVTTRGRYAGTMERPPTERAKRGIGWLGVPAMVGLLVVIAALTAIHGIGSLIVAAVGVLVLLLVIGIAMTVAARQ
jgi:hypothetical protein